MQTQASHEFLAASVAKNQQELEGKMALALIASVGASSSATNGQSTNPNLGQNVNIKV